MTQKFWYLIWVPIYPISPKYSDITWKQHIVHSASFAFSCLYKQGATGTQAKQIYARMTQTQNKGCFKVMSLQYTSWQSSMEEVTGYSIQHCSIGLHWKRYVMYLWQSSTFTKECIVMKFVRIWSCYKFIILVFKCTVSVPNIIAGYY